MRRRLNSVQDGVCYKYGSYSELQEYDSSVMRSRHSQYSVSIVIPLSRPMLIAGPYFPRHIRHAPLFAAIATERQVLAVAWLTEVVIVAVVLAQQVLLTDVLEAMRY